TPHGIARLILIRHAPLFGLLDNHGVASMALTAPASAASGAIPPRPVSGKDDLVTANGHANSLRANPGRGRLLDQDLAIGIFEHDIRTALAALAPHRRQRVAPCPAADLVHRIAAA